MTTTLIIVVLTILLTIGVVRSTRKERVREEDSNTSSADQEKTHETPEHQSDLHPTWQSNRTIWPSESIGTSVPVKKPTAKKPSADSKKAPAKKTPAKKTAAKKTPAKKNSGKKTTK